MRTITADYIALLEDEKIEFGWSQEELLRFRKAWAAGQSGDRIAKELRRDPDEVAILIISLRRQDLINTRPGGWKGDKHGPGSNQK